MSRILAIAGREYRANVRSKAFVISLVLMPVLMIGGAFVPTLLKGRVDVEDKRIVVADGTGGKVLAALQAAAAARNDRETRHPKTGKQIEPRYFIEAAPAPRLRDEDKLSLSEQVRKRRIHAFAEVEPDFLAPPDAGRPGAGARLHVESVGGELRRWFERVLGQVAQRERLLALGLDPASVARASVPVSIQPLGLYQRSSDGRLTSGDRGSRLAATFAPLVLLFLMFLAIMMSQTMLQSTLEEKQQRIAEVLLGSVRPSELMAGKVIGSTGVSLTTLSIYLAGGLWFVHQAGYGGLLRHSIVGWSLLFTAFGVVIFGAVYAAVGAACSELKEAQNYLMPVMLVLLVPLFVWSGLMEEPMSKFATTMSLIPLWTPMLMPLRMAATEAVPLWQPIVGVLLCLALAAVVVWAGGRILRVGLLMQGKAPKVRELVTWIVRG